jgi:hypothetical protein
MILSRPQEYLRDFIQDTRLLAALDLIEGYLGMPVAVKASTEVEIAGVQHKLPSTGYIFWYNPNADYVHKGVIFHELMHISLHIEGWPVHHYGEGFRELEAKHDRKFAVLLTDSLWDIFPHT